MPTTQLLNVGSGAAQVVGVVLALFVAKWTNRTIAGVFPLVLACVGAAMMLGISSSNNNARYGGYVLAYQCSLLRASWLLLPAYLGSLPDSDVQLTIYSPDLRFVHKYLYDCRYLWDYEEICLWVCLPTWLCDRQYYRAPNIQGIRCA